MEEFNKYVSYYTEGEYKNLDEILDKDLRRKIYNRARVQLERNNGKFVKPLKRGFDINAKEFNKGAKYYSEQPEFKIKKGTKFRNLPLIIRNKIRYNTYRNDNKFVPPKTPAEALKKSIPKKMQERIKLMIGEETPLDFKKYTYGVSKSLEGDGTKGGVKNPFYERARYWGNKREKSIENSIKRLAELRNKYGNFPLGVLDPKKAVWHDLFRGAVILKGDYGDLPVNKRFKLITKIPKAKENGKPDWKKNDAWRDAKFKDTVTGKIITYDNLEKITNDPKLGGPGAYQKAIQTAKNRRALYDAAIPIDGKKITLSGALVSKDLATNNRTPSTGIESHHFGEGGVKRNYWDTQLTTRESNRQLQYKQKSFLNKLNKTNDPNKILELRKGFDKFVTELPGGINYTFEGKIAGVTPTAGSVVSSLSQEKGLLKYPGIRDLITAIGSAKGKNLEVICRAIGKKSDGGISTTCAEAISDIKNNPANAATKLEGLKPTSAVLGKVRNAASAFLKFAGKGKTFAITAGVGAGAGALVKAFRNDDPETYLINDKQANAMILETADQLEREERQAAVGDAPELLDESAIGAELAVTGAAVPGSKKLFDARKKKGFGAVRAGLGPVGKALSGFATPLGIAATTPLNVASQVYAGDSAEEILTDPLNYLGPAFAGTLTKEATRGMNPTGMLSKALRLGMNPATIRAGSKFLGLPGLALSLGYEGYDQYKKYTEGRGFVYNLLNKDE
jgi:hypothetical protein